MPLSPRFRSWSNKNNHSNKYVMHQVGTRGLSLSAYSQGEWHRKPFRLYVWFFCLQFFLCHPPKRSTCFCTQVDGKIVPLFWVFCLWSISSFFVHCTFLYRRKFCRSNSPSYIIWFGCNLFVERTFFRRGVRQCCQGWSTIKLIFHPTQGPECVE